MNGAARKQLKSDLKAALRAKALGLPLSPEAEAVFAEVERLCQQEAPAAKRVLAWAAGTSLTLIAYHERTGVRTIQNRIDQCLDTMRLG